MAVTTKSQTPQTFDRRSKSCLTKQTSLIIVAVCLVLVTSVFGAAIVTGNLLRLLAIVGSETTSKSDSTSITAANPTTVASPTPLLSNK